MFSKRLLIGSFFLSAALLAPAGIRTSAAPQGVTLRYYDRDHRDYHNWDDHEGQYYTRYRVEHPRYNDDFARNNRRRQRDYWRWRHEHERENENN